jgi:hypothetical protein
LNWRDFAVSVTDELEEASEGEIYDEELQPEPEDGVVNVHGSGSESD